jgi:transmembrane sensor
MKQNYDHIPPEHRLSEEEEALLNGMTPPFSETRQDIWAKLENELEEPLEVPQGKVIRMGWVKYAAAAALALVISTGAFMRLHSVEVNSQLGEHTTHVLPDGSIVELNASSGISYHPYWWSFSREINFEGEAFFEVEPGSNFAVISNNGTTEVLGTSFNINARGDRYNVFCRTGKVRVSNAQAAVTIMPNMSATLRETTRFDVEDDISEASVLGWTKNQLTFSSVQLAELTAELEMQYAVEIQIGIPSPVHVICSANFEKPKTAEEAIALICAGNGLDYRKLGDAKFMIIRPD